VDSAWWALRVGLGPFLAGLDKFFNFLTDWKMYLSPLATHMWPVSDVVFMRFVGVVEMIVGLAILTRWTRIASYVAMLWLVAIAANRVSTGMFFDLAVRGQSEALWKGGRGILEARPRILRRFAPQISVTLSHHDGTEL
jgi:hypothetical protein